MKNGANNVLKLNPNKSPEALINVHLEKNNPEKIKGDKNLLEICFHPFIPLHLALSLCLFKNL